MSQKQSVGRIVHFFTKDRLNQYNGVGEGPYAAIITQVFTDGGGEVGPQSYVNMKVFTPFGEPRDEGSVRHKDVDGDQGRYWTWPERV